MPDQIGMLLGGDQTDHTMRALIQSYDHVIVDTPPIMGVADSGILGQWVDMALLAVRIAKTPKSHVTQATELLETAGVNVAGVIAVDDKASSSRGESYGYGYGY
jgi:Mrp family chromosome partitioning ATPase